MKKQTIETLVNEEIQLFDKFLRPKKDFWEARILTNFLILFFNIFKIEKSISLEKNLSSD